MVFENYKHRLVARVSFDELREQYKKHNESYEDTMAYFEQEVQEEWKDKLKPDSSIVCDANKEGAVFYSFI